MIEMQPVKGTRDFYPEQMQIRNWLFDVWRTTATQFGFSEYDACVLESADLYIRKAGDEITDQLYVFKDKSDRTLSLRPEMTPSLARLVLQHQKALSFPIKWFSIAQCFRYERMTKGRKREHFQWNADIVGQPGEVAEAEVLSMLLMACESLGLTKDNVCVFLNDRRILNAILDQINVPKDQQLKIMIVMDKRDKISPEAFADLLQKEGMQSDQIEQLNTFLGVEQIEELALRLDDQTGIQSLKRVIELVENAGHGDYLKFDVSIVRGLSYYTGTVFEMNDPTKSQRAICGGGRYDSLLSSYGGDSVPAVGFGFGDVVILDVLSDLGKVPTSQKGVDVLVVPFSQNEVGAALKIGNQLRRSAMAVDCDFSFKKVKKILQQASENRVHDVLLLFPEELEEGKVVWRNMETRNQQAVAIDSVVAAITESRNK